MFSRTDSSPEAEEGKPWAVHREVAILDVQGMNGQEPQGVNRHRRRSINDLGYSADGRKG